MKNFLFIFIIFTNIFAKDIVFSKEVYDALSLANKNIEAKEFKKAINLLKNVKSEKEEEQIYILNTLAQVYLNIEDYANAAANIEKTLNYEKLDDKLKKELISNLLQIYLIKKDYKKSIILFDQYKKQNSKISPEIYANIAVSYLELKEYKQAILHIQKAIKLKPKNKNFIQILLSIYYKLKDYKQVCAILESAYRLDISSEFATSLAHCLYEKAPLRGANILQNALSSNKVKSTKSNLKLLFSLYIEAKEYDKAYKIAQKINENQISLYIIQSYFDKGKYEKTIEAVNFLQNSIDPKTKPQIKIIQAQSYYYLNNNKKALEIFKEISKLPKVRSLALEWIKYIKD